MIMNYLMRGQGRLRENCFKAEKARMYICPVMMRRGMPSIL